MQFFTLSSAAGSFVSRLFQGLADGKPDVAEDELLKAAEATSMSDLFPCSARQDDRGAWESLFVPRRPAQHVATQRTGTHESAAGLV